MVKVTRVTTVETVSNFADSYILNSVNYNARKYLSGELLGDFPIQLFICFIKFRLKTNNLIIHSGGALRR